MVSVTLLAILAFATAAFAGPQTPNNPPPLPVNSQIGGLHFPFTCEILGSLNQTFEVLATGTGPSYGASGSDFYLTDTVAHILIPDAVLALARKLSATQATANVSLYLDASNASPSQILAYQGTIDIAIPANGSTTLRLPGGNGTLPAVGPFTLGPNTDPARLAIGHTDVSLDLKNSSGASVSGPITITCGKQNIDYIIAEISVDNTINSTSAVPANGYVPNFPYFPLNSEYGFFRFPYKCSFGSFGEHSLDLTIGGTIPTYFAPGQEFNLTQSENFLRLPASIVDRAKQAYPKITTLHTTISRFDVLFTNAYPPTFNAASVPLTATIDIANVCATEPLVIPVPQSGDLSLGPITAGQTVGGIVDVSIGNATGIAEFRDVNGKSLLSLDVTCFPVAYLELIGIVITDQKPDNYTLGVNHAA